MFCSVLESSLRDSTIGCLVDLRLGKAQPLHFGARRLPETRRTQNIISFLKQETAWASSGHLLLQSLCPDHGESSLHRQLCGGFPLEATETSFEDDDEDQRQYEQDA